MWNGHDSPITIALNALLMLPFPRAQYHFQGSAPSFQHPSDPSNTGHRNAPHAEHPHPTLSFQSQQIHIQLNHSVPQQAPTSRGLPSIAALKAASAARSQSALVLNHGMQINGTEGSHKLPGTSVISSIQSSQITAAPHMVSRKRKRDETDLNSGIDPLRLPPSHRTPQDEPGFPQDLFYVKQCNNTITINTDHDVTPDAFQLAHCRDQNKRFHGQLESMSRIVMKQSQVLQKAMNELAEYKSKVHLSRPITEPKVNITLDTKFLSTFASDTACVVMSKDLMERIAFEAVEFYPRGSFFCNRAFASMLMVSLDDILSPKFCHHGIGLWTYSALLRKHPKTVENTRFVLNSGIQRVGYKMPLMDRDSNIIITDCETHIGDMYVWMTFLPVDAYDNSFAMDGHQFVKGEAIAFETVHEEQIVRDVLQMRERSKANPQVEMMQIDDDP